MTDILTTLREQRGLTTAMGFRIAGANTPSGDYRYVSIKAGPCETREAVEAAWLAAFDEAFPNAAGTLYWRPGRLPGFPEIKELTVKRARATSDAIPAPGWYGYGRCVVVPT